MSKRYYVCDVIGDGSEFNPYRPAIADESDVNWAASVPTGQDGKPLKTSAMVIAATRNHAKLRGKPGINDLPDYPLDGKANAIDNSARSKMFAMLENRGISTGNAKTADGYRHLLDAVGKELDSDFDVDNFDVSDV